MKKNYIEYLGCLCLLLFIIFSNKVDLYTINKDEFTVNNISSYINSSIIKENTELEEIIKLNDYFYNKCIVTKIKFNNVYNLTDSIILYKGSKENVTKGMAIVNNDGLVGIVSKTYDHTSSGKLITNKDFVISVKINQSFGILKNDGKNVIVENIEKNCSIHNGDLIYTSGITGIPGDIYIGKVKEIIDDDLNLEKKVIVDLSYDIHNLKYVVLI